MIAYGGAPAFPARVPPSFVLADAGAPAFDAHVFLFVVLADARAVAVLALALLAAVLACRPPCAQRSPPAPTRRPQTIT